MLARMTESAAPSFHPAPLKTGPVIASASHPGQICAIESIQLQQERRNIMRHVWTVAAAAAALNVLAYPLSLYELTWFDKGLHAFTLFALTLLGAHVFSSDLASARREVGFILLVSFGVSLGAGWELVEWLYDSFAEGNAIKGKDDTMLDLVWDTGGAGLAALLALRSR